MNFWDNLIIMIPPKLKRSTHQYCFFCGTNLEEYRQLSCNRCLLPLHEEEGMVVTGSDLRKDMGFMKRMRLTIKSTFLRFVKWSGF